MSLVKFIKGTQEEIDATPIVDGQVLFQIGVDDDGKIYHDDGDKRYVVGGKTDVYDGLNSTDATIALSANQGRVLNNQHTNLSTSVWSLKSGIDSLLHPSVWSDAAPYTYTVPILGLKETDRPSIEIIYTSTTPEEQEAQMTEANKLALNPESVADGIKFTCYEEKPTRSIIVRIKGVQ